jgi:FkbM family methyltransferase
MLSADSMTDATKLRNGALVERFVKPGDTCIDIGANFGIYTALLASLVGERGRVVAMEPSPPALRRLRQLERQVAWLEVNDVAAGSGRKTESLAVAPGDAMHSTLRATFDPAVSRQAVEVLPLTEVVPDTRIAIVKVDVEGYEGEVIRGMLPLLNRRQVGAVMLEAQPAYGDLGWLRWLLDGPSYELFHLTLERKLLRWRPKLVRVQASTQVAGNVFLVQQGHCPFAAASR